MPLKVQRTFKGETSRTGDNKEEVWGFDVHASDLTFTVMQAKTAVDTADATKKIPAKGDVHPEDEGMMCAEIQASRDESRPTLIRVTVTWRSPQGQGESQGGGDEEEITPIGNIELGFDREAYTELRNKTLDDEAIINSAGDFFSPVERKGTDAVYLYTYFVKNLAWDVMGEAHGMINSAEVVLNFNGRTKTFAPKTLMFEPRFSVVDTLSDGGMVYKVECRLTHRATGWQPKLVDQGLNAYGDAGTEAELFKNRILIAGQPVSEDQLLDGDGHKLADGAAAVLMPKATTPGDPSPGFKMYELLDFTTLPGFGG